MFNGHRTQMRDDAAAYHAEARRCRRRRLVHVAVGVAVEDGPVSGHAEVNADTDIIIVAFALSTKL